MIPFSRFFFLQMHCDLDQECNVELENVIFLFI